MRLPRQSTQIQAGKLDPLLAPFRYQVIEKRKRCLNKVWQTAGMEEKVYRQSLAAKSGTTVARSAFNPIHRVGKRGFSTAQKEGIPGGSALSKNGIKSSNGRSAINGNEAVAQSKANEEKGRKKRNIDSMYGHLYSY